MRRPRTRYQGPAGGHHPRAGEPRHDVAAPKPALEPAGDGVTDGLGAYGAAVATKREHDRAARRGLSRARSRRRA